MPKITIYVPDDLKSEMDAAEKQEPNWSAIAQEAFRVECRLLSNRKKGASKMDAVIERLRKSKEALASRDRVDGHAAGRLWGMNRAGYDELEAVAKFAGEPGSYGENVAWTIVQLVLSDDNHLREDQLEWMERTFGEGETSDDYAAGFAEGAAEIFDEVADKL